MPIIRNKTTAKIVLNAIREHLSAISSDVTNYHRDSTRSEDLDEAIRLTRVIKYATSLIDCAAL